MDGILPLWKPKGPTSHDCVFKIRKLLRKKKVGHTGTLDPEVDGVLPICLGKATKIAEYITNAGKEYEAEVTIGISTSTEDASGEVIETKRVDETLAAVDVASVLRELTGEIEQTPPMYSAIKVNGKRLYEYARAGIEIERPSRKVVIYQLELLHNQIMHRDGKLVFNIRVKCSKGTYIRTLAVMIGERLGYPAHMSALTRISAASITMGDCVTLEQLEALIQENQDVNSIIKPLETGLSDLPKWEMDRILLEKVKNGAVLPAPEGWPDGEVAMSYAEAVYAIYQLHPQKQGLIKPVKVIRSN